MVQLMGGNIEVKSQKNVGSTFEVNLKLPIGIPSRLYAQGDTEAPKDLNGINVLLVEDNEMNRYIIFSMRKRK